MSNTFHFHAGSGIPPMPEPTTESEFRRLIGLHYIFKPEETEMSGFHNPHAQDLAREILDNRTTAGLRDKVEAAVAHLTELVADTQCGSTLTFMKVTDNGKHYFYAAVKNGEKWYTTAQNPRVLEDDDRLIEWLIGLEIWEAPQLEVTTSRHAHELSAPIETTATES